MADENDERKVELPDYRTVKQIKAIARAIARIEELKNDGSLPESMQKIDFSSTQNLITFANSAYGKKELGEIVDDLPKKNEAEEKMAYYRLLSKENGGSFTVEDAEKLEKKYILDKEDDRDTTQSRIIYLEQKLQEMKPRVKDVKKKSRKALRKMRLCKFGNFLMGFLGFAIRASIVVGIFALPYVTGLGSLFFGSTNAFIGTIACAFASYYALKQLNDAIKEVTKSFFDNGKKSAEKMLAEANGDECQKVIKDYEKTRDAIKELSRHKESLANQMESFNPTFISMVNKQSLNNKLKALYASEKSTKEEKEEKKPDSKNEEINTKKVYKKDDQPSSIKVASVEPARENLDSKKELDKEFENLSKYDEQNVFEADKNSYTSKRKNKIQDRDGDVVVER